MIYSLKINNVNQFGAFEFVLTVMKMRNNFQRSILLVFGISYLFPLSRHQELAIDNQLVIVANDCYTRISIGLRIPEKDIALNKRVNGVTECEEECSSRRNSCIAFSFGISIKGNASCILSSKLPNPDDLEEDSDYDIYLRSQRSPHCESDRLFKTVNINVKEKRKNNTRENSRYAGGLFGSILTNIYQPTRSDKNGQKPNATRQVYAATSYDEEEQIIGIVRNKNLGEKKFPIFGNYNTEKLTHRNEFEEKKPETSTSFGQKVYFKKDNTNVYKDLNSFGRPVPLIDRPIYDNIWQSKYFENYGFIPQEEIFSKPIGIYDVYEKNEFKVPSDASFSLENGYRSETLYLNKNKNNLAESHPTKTTVLSATKEKTQLQNESMGKYWNDRNRPIYQNFAMNDNKNLFNLEKKNQQIKEEKKPCYRRLLNGKKTEQVHVRRALECQRIEECQRACDYEKYFRCQGFNYRRMGSGSRGMCEMTSVPYSRMDIHRDFIIDPQCDYYDRDPDCLREIENQQSWSGYLSRPVETYISISGEPSGRPVNAFKPNTLLFGPDQRPLTEIPRPFDYKQRPIYQKVDSERPIELPRPIETDSRPLIYGNFYGLSGESLYHRPSNAQDGRPIDNYNGNGYSYGKPQYSRPTYNVPIERPYPSKQFPDRRVDYNPYNDIGTNEVGPYSSERKENYRDWPIYGSSYGYDTNYVGQFDIPKHYVKPPSQRPHQLVRPQESDHYYGESFNYGGTFGYGNNYVPPTGDRSQFYDGTKKRQRCIVRAGVGVKLSRSIARKTYLTPNLEECESLCLYEKSFLCMTLSYRYNVAPTDPTDNCFLTEMSYKELNFYTDIEPNRDYDIYAMIADSRTCRITQYHHPPDECFWRVRSGFGMPSDIIRKSITVINLGECQLECNQAQEFTCRSFAFKYGSRSVQRTPSTNCFLSDWPTQEINPVTIPDMDGAELYERGSFGRGCEPYPFPALKIGGYNKLSHGEDVCYSSYHKPCRLTPYSVMLSIHVDSENDCRERCSKMRQKNPIPCMSFSYKIRADRREQNCFLSDISIRDLRPGLDYSYDNDHVLFSWKELEPQCMITGYSIDDNHVIDNPGHGYGRPLSPLPSNQPDSGPGSDQSDGIYIPDPRPFYGHDISRPFDIGPQHSLRPYDPDRPDLVRPPIDNPHDTSGPPGGHTNHGNDYIFNFPGSYEQDNNFLLSPEFSTFQHYTVNGHPCKRGTKCEKNNVAGFWSCETEGGEFGSWDYCCEPNHHCGYSQGYHYLWCYVGISDDQWRPCSEKYYPYLPSSQPNHYGDYHNNPHRDHIDLNYFARHWPVTYLHKEPPPNCTDSLASPDNNRDRRLNETLSIEPKENDSHNDDRTARLKSRTIKRLISRTVIPNNAENIPRHYENEHDGRILFSEKIITKLATDTGSSNSERFGKVEKSTKPILNFPGSDSIPIAVPFITKQNGRHMERSVNMTMIMPINNEFANFTSLYNYTSLKVK